VDYARFPRLILIFAFFLHELLKPRTFPAVRHVKDSTRGDVMLGKRSLNCLFVVIWSVVSCTCCLRQGFAIPAPAEPVITETQIRTGDTDSSESQTTQTPPQQGVPYFPPASPSPGPGKTGWMDVGSCALLVAAVGTIGRSAGRIAKAFGDVVKASHLKVSEWLRMDPSVLTTVDVIASLLGYKVLPKSIYEMSLENFWKTVVMKLWAGCENVGTEFLTLPSSIRELIKSPEFYIPGRNDSPGVRTRRYCADKTRGYG